MTETAALIPVPPTSSKSSRKRSRALVRSKPVQPSKPDQNASWVVFWASEDPKLKRVLIGCERCGCRLSFPNKTPVYKIESALFGFRLDHQNCKLEDKKSPGPINSVR